MMFGSTDHNYRLTKLLLILCSDHAELGNLAQTKNRPASASIYQQSTLILIKNIIGYSLLVNCDLIILRIHHM